MTAVVAKVRARSSVVAPTAVAAAGAFVASAAYVRGSSLPAAAVVAVTGGLVVLAAPRVAVLLLLLGGAFVLPDPVLRLHVAGFQTDLIELCVFGLVGWWVFRRATDTSTSANRFAAPLLLFVMAAAIGAGVGLLAGASRDAVQGPLKTYIFYLLALPLALAFPGATGRRHLSRWVLNIATVGSAIVVVLAVSGRAQLTGGTVDTVITLAESTAAQRVRLPLLGLVFVAFLLVVGRIATRGWDALTLAQISLFGATLALSFNRSTWVPLLVSVLVLVRLRPGERVPLRAAATSLTLVIVVPALLLASGAGLFGPTGRALADRLASTTNPAVVREASFEYRTTEYEAAARAIRRNPAFGVGLGRPYGVTRTRYLDDPPRLVHVQQTYVHNGLLGTWLQLGALGVIATLILWKRAADAVRRGRAASDVEDGTIVLVGAVAVLGLALQSMLQTNLGHRPTIIALGVALTLAAGLPESLATNRTDGAR